MQDRQHCPLCDRNGIVSYLNSFQINLDEAVLLCENSKCLYPVGLDSHEGRNDNSITFRRKFSSLASCRQDDGPPAGVPSAQQSLQVQLAPLAARQNIQKVVFGTQTGSPLFTSLNSTKKTSIVRPNGLNGLTRLNDRPLLNGLSHVTSSRIQVRLNASDGGLPSQQQFKSVQSVPSLARNIIIGKNGTQTRSNLDFPPFQLDPKTDNGLSLKNGSAFDKITDVSENFEVENDLNSLFELVSANEKDSIPSSVSKSKEIKSVASNNLENGRNLLKTDKNRLGSETGQQLNCLNHCKEPKLDLFPQWLNRDSLCWLDVVLCLLVHNQTVRKLVLGDKYERNCLIYKLLKAHDQARLILDKLQRRSSDEKPTKSKTCTGSIANGSKAAVNGVQQGHINGIMKDTEEATSRKDAGSALEMASEKHFKKTNRADKPDGEESEQSTNATEKKGVGNTDRASTAVNKENMIVNGIGDTGKAEAVDELDTVVVDRASTAVNKENMIVNGIGDTGKAEAVDELDTVAQDMVAMHELLEGVREEVWSGLKVKLRCERGQKDSPVFAMPLLLQGSPEVERLFRMGYRFYCDKCQQEEENEYENSMPTFPSLADDFTMEEPRHVRECFRCHHKLGSRTMRYKRLPKCLLMHFVDGLPNNDWSRLQFGFHGNAYTVTGIVQYVKQPDHFIAWLRNQKTNQWVKCDDLGTLVCQFEETVPDIPKEQVHVVMWERVAGPRLAPKFAETSGGYPAVLSKQSVINPSDFSNGKQFILNRFCGSGQDQCKVCKRVVSMKNHLCERCLKFTENGNQNSSIKFPGLYPGSSDTSNSYNSVSKHVPVAGVQGSSLEPMVFMGSVKQGTGADDSRSSTPCSSLSSLSETSAESVILPKFTISCAQENSRLVKPVPCKMDVLGLKSTGSSSRLKSAALDGGDNSEGFASNSSTARPSHGSLSLLRFLKGLNASTAVKSEKTDLKVETGLLLGRSAAKPGSAFHAAPKSKGRISKETSSEDNSTVSSKTSTVKAKNTLHRQKSNGAINKSESTPSLQSKFKLPLSLRKQASSGNLAKDAFKTLSRTVNSNNSKGSSPASSSSPSPVGSPALVGINSYLSTVKQYLINKTTGSAEARSKFEGLNLRTAPDLKRSTNLSGLHFSTQTTSPASDGKSSSSSGNSSGGSLIKNNKGVKRSSCDNITAVQPKLVRKQSTDNPMNRMELRSVKSSITGAKPKGDGSSMKPVYGRRKGGKNMTLIKEFNEKKEKQSAPSSSNCKRPLENNQPSETAMQTFSKDSQLEQPRCETETVLQDLYEALNIPFKSVPDTMSDIMMDVNDILGMVDTSKMVPGTPTLASTGNQASLDCSIPMMVRKRA